MLITNKHLEGACQDQVNLFNETFPVGAEFNKTNWGLALTVGLQVTWMERFLDESNRKIYDKAIAPARKIYDEARVPARKTYKEAIAPASKIYEEARAPALKIYDEAIAAALFDALEQQFFNAIGYTKFKTYFRYITNTFKEELNAQNF